MNKTELIAAVAEKANLSKKDADSAVNAIIDTIIAQVSQGDRVQLVGFGTFMLGSETCKNAVVAAIQNDYRMIDTAEAYGGGNAGKERGVSWERTGSQEGRSIQQTQRARCGDREGAAYAMACG